MGGEGGDAHTPHHSANTTTATFITTTARNVTGASSWFNLL